ncbi:MAG: bifunctional DNA-formamidopyrimidine glycosylase/DNA-(apurinic or apyrimidinic site) lyase [Kofleriaceae bacterium]
MPELPEVETVRRTLMPAIGATIETIWDSGQGLHMARKPPRKQLQKLLGATIVGLRRHGKYLLVDTDTPESLIVHLGMTGRFCILPARTPRAAHTHFVAGLGTRELRFSDPRRFGQIDVVTRGRERTHPALAGLGVDALTERLDVRLFHAGARVSRSTLKAFILDQGVIAGVGNIYASEALWRAGLRPTKRTKRLTTDGAKRLVEAIREVIDRALENGGTTLADFVDANGTAGDNAEYLWVYDRAGQPCKRCESPIKRSVLQGRATYYCPTCQTP